LIFLSINIMEFEKLNVAKQITKEDDSNSVEIARNKSFQQMVEQNQKSSERFDRNISESTLESLRKSNPGVADQDLMTAFEINTETNTHEYQEEVGNLIIKMIGVPHTAYAIPVLRQRLEAMIDESDLTILETGVQIKSPEYARLKKIDSHPDAVFFYQVEQMAKMRKNKIILIDPGYSHIGTDNEQNSYQKKLFDLDDKIQAGLALGGSAAVSAGMVAGAWAMADALNKKVMSRRTFLKLGASAALTASGLGSVTVAKNNEQHKNLALQPEERVGLYNFHDYRDVVIAEGITKLSKSLTEKTTATLVFGMGHVDGIKYYLDNPEMRAFKLAAYKPYKDNSQTYISTYDFILDDNITEERVKASDWGEWKQSSVIDIF